MKLYHRPILLFKEKFSLSVHYWSSKSSAYLFYVSICLCTYMAISAFIQTYPLLPCQFSTNAVLPLTCIHIYRYYITRKIFSCKNGILIKAIPSTPNAKTPKLSPLANDECISSVFLQDRSCRRPFPFIMMPVCLCTNFGIRCKRCFLKLIGFYLGHRRIHMIA